jgi:hypothetical protein
MSEDFALIFSSYDTDVQCKDEIVKKLSGASYSTRTALINAKYANLTPLILSVTNGYYRNSNLFNR